MIIPRVALDDLCSNTILLDLNNGEAINSQAMPDTFDEWSKTVPNIGALPAVIIFNVSGTDRGLKRIATLSTIFSVNFFLPTSSCPP